MKKDEDKEIEIHEKLKQLRKERGLTLNNLADKIGSDYQQISRIERGKSRLTIDVLMKMADALETPVHELVKAKPEEKEGKAIPFPMQKADLLLPQETLAIILEKLDLVLAETHTTVRPQTKAALASHIFTEVIKNQDLSHDSLPASVLIDFALAIVKTLLSDIK